VLKRIADEHRATPAQITLAWVLRQDCVSAIPKSSTPTHVRENRAALDIELTAKDLEAIDREFPPPTQPKPLEMI
jgi:diketogulonate reductase-like aldo/keto reductase